MNHEKKESAQKLRGGYYTPKSISDFMCRWCIQSNTQSILEPSCGDGNFIQSSIERLRNLNIEKDSIGKIITGVELIENEAVKASNRALELGVKDVNIINLDYFHYVNENNNLKFDSIVGNPPFIRYQNFPEEHRELAMELMKTIGLKPNKLTNIWVPFLVISASLLNANGKLAMVIPAELFQVKYAAETRKFLSDFFSRITIVTFKKLVFTDIQQEVVLLLCEKEVDRGKGIRVIECDNLEDLNNVDFQKINGSGVKSVDHNTEKWTKYFLEGSEIELLRRIKIDLRTVPCKEIFATEVGLVTGRNEFFMMNAEQVETWKLEKYVIPVVSKSNQLQGIEFTSMDFSNNSKIQKPVYLFLPPDEDFDDLPEVCKKYIKYGELNGFDKGYKTRIRKRWYITPSRWIPDGFALRQVGEWPKIVENKTNASSTDTIHRIRFRKEVDRKKASIAFMNSLSFAFAEITGRSYGGGVLTFEPSEIAEIRIPKFDKLNLDFDLIDSLVRNREIEKVLDIVDKELLIKIQKFDENEVEVLRGIWKKLSQRRMNRNK